MNQILILLLLACPALGAERVVALTFDDLPNGGARLPLKDLQSMTARLHGALKAAGAPAIGFVSGSKLDIEGEREARLAVVRSWLDAGYPLANHTFSHPDINTTPLLVYQQDVIRNEEALSALFKSSSARMEWFRHPFTHTGADSQTRENLDAFLRHRGYRTAAFTVEQSDWMFNLVYIRARRAGDEALATRVRKAYLDYTETMFDWFERLSEEYFDYEVPQVLLIHANPLNADAMGEMLARLKQRGYRFVSLEEAMKDEAYARHDGYIGKSGPSYLYRWAAGAGKPNRLRDEPAPPTWLYQMYQEATK